MARAKRKPTLTVATMTAYEGTRYLLLLGIKAAIDQILAELRQISASVRRPELRT
jgi:hypothetical protein